MLEVNGSTFQLKSIAGVNQSHITRPALLPAYRLRFYHSASHEEYCVLTEEFCWC